MGQITKSKSKVFFISLLVFIFGFLAACSSSESGSTNSGGQDSTSTETNNSDETFRFSYTSAFPPASWDYEAAHYMVEEFVEEVEARSEGRITFEKSYSNSLVPQNELLDALAAGTVDFALASPGFFGDVVSSATFSTLPFWSPNDEFGYRILKDSEIGDILDQEIEDYGAKILMYGPTGEYGFISNEPIRKYEDFNGLLIRAGGNLWNAWYDEMGAAPANVSVVESYEALQRGTINATGTPYHNIETFNYHEVAGYMIKPPVYSSIFMITLASQQAWNKLPEDLQDLLLEVSLEMEHKSIDGAKVFNENNDSMAEGFGVEVITLPEEEVEKWEESGQAAWERFANLSENNKRIIELLRDELEALE
ncbi:TRAP transporter substrate-binding protein [Alkalihalobacillus sp. MEB130]|uniref:TRAP transporter substrate-binding protein n=1 Tax=Alkalihalobacillus sp. MEB130 TaxID=2976704 RepID=UPI0028DEEF7B|nr:TRAP transporter substrate-binding protein [Alkalihalobacillus sp. MEB130]MDT8862969.1 TRAP transporter substrate-binding protein [Alkalihalobacillus sp. MEB130]